MAAEERTLEIVLKARDEASKALDDAAGAADKASKNVDGLSKNLKIAGGILSGIGAAGVVLMKTWVDKASESQTAMASVDAILKQTSESMKYSTVVVKGTASANASHVASIDKQIAAQQKQLQILKLSDPANKGAIENIQKSINALKLEELRTESNTGTKDRAIQVVNKHALSFDQLREKAEDAGAAMAALGFDDEEAATVFAKTVQITGDVAKAQTTMGIAADLARFKGIGLAEASQSLNMALMGNTKVLKQLGIEVEDNMTKEQVLAAIRAKTAGQAQAYAHTYAGAMDILKVTMDNLQESLGERLLPAVTNIVTKISDFVDGLNNLDPKVFDIIVKVTAAATAFGLIAGPLLFIVGSLPAIAAGFTALAGPLGIIILVAAAVAAAAFLIVQNWSTIQPAIQPAIDAVKGFFDMVWQGIQSFVLENMPFFQNAWAFLQGAITLGLQVIQTIWTAVWPGLKILFSGIWNEIVGIFKVLWGILQVAISIGLGIVTGDWTKAWSGMKKGFLDIFEGLGNFVKGWWESIVGFFRSGLGAMIGVINSAIDVVNRAGSKMGVNIPKIPAFANGGWVNETGIALVHKGEFVMSNDMLAGRAAVPGNVSNNTNNNSNVTIGPVYVQSETDIELLAQRLAFNYNNSGSL